MSEKTTLICDVCGNECDQARYFTASWCLKHNRYSYTSGVTKDLCSRVCLVKALAPFQEQPAPLEVIGAFLSKEAHRLMDSFKERIRELEAEVRTERERGDRIECELCTERGRSGKLSAGLGGALEASWSSAVTVRGER